MTRSLPCTGCRSRPCAAPRTADSLPSGRRRPMSPSWTAASGDVTPQRPTPQVPRPAAATASTTAPRCARRSLTTLAERELAAGERQRAVALLRAALLDAEPATAAPDSDLIAAATLYAATVHPGEVAHSQALRWARYAHRCSQQLLGAHHEATIRAGGVLAQVLTVHGLDTAAVALRQQIVATLGRRDGLLAATTIAARVDLALTQHAASFCDAAIDGLTRTWRAWCRRHGPADRGSIAMLLHLAALLDACGDHDAAGAHTRQAFAWYATPTDPTSHHAALPAVPWTAGPDPDDRHAGLCNRTAGRTSGGTPRWPVQRPALSERRPQP